MRNDAEIQRILAVSEGRGEFVQLEDGYVYFWPDKSSHGALAAWHLRTLADELDRRNKDWDAEINSYFDSQSNELPPLDLSDFESPK